MSARVYTEYTARKLLDEKLAERGFVHGKYGDVPYELSVSRTVTADDGSHVDIIHAEIYLDKRKVGWATVFRDGTVDLQIDIAKWLTSEQTMYDKLQFTKFPMFDRAKERAAIALSLTEDEALLDMWKKGNGGSI